MNKITNPPLPEDVIGTYSLPCFVSTFSAPEPGQVLRSVYATAHMVFLPVQPVLITLCDMTIMPV